ncbi:flagellin N-terminal helical domain-containing protein [Butyrivibrio sp. VCD2006]|uniref:flagellin N-terminal helical domain-containing protein n=1 Tax=Butyrivibrio sp. VCD2006 TaxID=1280664 RepID=UPI0003FD0B2C|nr:flagellin [Butyrivibrio sp. VCD2006]
MQVNYNISAMIANNALVANDNKLAESIERLSSGLKIANAKDNPSGLAISRRMNAQIKSLGVAVGNSGDGVSVIQTADGTLSEVHDILQRMSELAIQAANGTNSETDLGIIQDEIIQLKDEITRIAEATQFNGQTLLDGTFDNRGYCTINDVTDPEITVNSYSDFVGGGNYYIEDIHCDYNSKTGKITLLDENGYKVDTLKTNVTKVSFSQGRETEDEKYMYQADVVADGDLIRISTSDGKEIEIKVNQDLNGERIDMELTGKGAMTMQVGANEGQTLDIRIPKVTLSNLGIEYVDFTRTIKDDVADNLNAITTDDTHVLPDESFAQAEWTKIMNCRTCLYDFAQYTKAEIQNGTYDHVDSDLVAKVKSIRQDDQRTDDEKENMILGLWTERYMTKVNAIDEIDQGVDEVGNPYSALDKLTKYDNENFITENWQYEIDITLNDSTLSSYQAGIKLDGILKGALEKGNYGKYTGADQAIEDISKAIQKVSDIRSRLGAYQNRLDHTISNTNMTSENMTSAYSRIMDVDMADEMTIYSTQQVLSQAGTSMLAQANERPQQILQLLQ